MGLIGHRKSKAHVHDKTWIFVRFVRGLVHLVSGSVSSASSEPITLCYSITMHAIMAILRRAVTTNLILMALIPGTGTFLSAPTKTRKVVRLQTASGTT